MINRISTLVISTSLFFGACGSNNNKKDDKNNQSSTNMEEVTQEDTLPVDINTTASTFDINTIPKSSQLSGDFPYFKPPQGYTFKKPHSYTGDGEVKDYDKEFFIINGAYHPMEGKTFKASIRISDDVKDSKEFSKLELQKNFDQYIERMGGVKLNNGTPISSEEKKRLRKDEPNAYSDGYLHSCNNWDDVHSYVIRTADKVVWIQMNMGSNDASYTVLEVKELENTMSTIKADQIEKDLASQGKSVLYINFDVDKATLKSDGKQVVDEIKKVLANNKDLKLRIEGHTDNTGDKAHNKKLSNERANTVLKELTSSGIDQTRLKASGYGDEKPLVANDSEANKAKNRRVELVKI